MGAPGRGDSDADVVMVATGPGIVRRSATRALQAWSSMPVDPEIRPGESGRSRAEWAVHPAMIGRGSVIDRERTAG